MNSIYPVILAGGSGTRLWPLSRKNYPKQFLRLQGEQSLLQQTVARAAVLEPKELLVVCNEAHYFLCQEQLQEQSIPVHYLLEPLARNTAAAIAAAALHLQQRVGPEALLLIMPSDHWVGDVHAWAETMQQGAHFLRQQDKLVTFGISPQGPKTAYGYIKTAASIAEGVYALDSFHEKPEQAVAERYFNSRDYYWNSGIFLGQAQKWLTELKALVPAIYEQVCLSYTQGSAIQDYYRLDAQALQNTESESIDYAVMEKTQDAVLVPLNIAWSDLGCWAAVAEANQPDLDGNSLQGNVIAQNSQDCLISSEDILVTTLGIRHQIVVATKDAVLVADKAYAQQVKDLVANLQPSQSHLAENHERVYRPWGYYEVLAEGETFKVKRIMVKPKAKLSLQMHQHRAEHWVVVAGEAEVVNDDLCFSLFVNQSTYIPQQTKHRLSNPGIEPLYLIEVQSGAYLGEDDIQRFDDMYHRPEVEKLK